jgi:hypothetical protein
MIDARAFCYLIGTILEPADPNMRIGLFGLQYYYVIHAYAAPGSPCVVCDGDAHYRFRRYTARNMNAMRFMDYCYDCVIINYEPP